MTTPKERIEIILKEHKITVADLAKGLEVQRHIIAGVINGKVSTISIDLAEKLLSVYPEYSKLWLLAGDEPKYAIQLSGDTNVDVDMSEGKRENSGSGNYFEGADAATIRLQLENEHLKADIEKLKADLEKSEAERKDLLKKLLNL